MKIRRMLLDAEVHDSIYPHTLYEASDYKDIKSSFKRKDCFAVFIVESLVPLIAQNLKDYKEIFNTLDNLEVTNYRILLYEYTEPKWYNSLWLME